MPPADNNDPLPEGGATPPGSGGSDESGTGVIKHETVRLAPPSVPHPGSQSASTDRRGGPSDTFTTGQTVSGRYRIIRFIAKGGMGEVYEAEDLEFSGAQPGSIERVALKTVRMDMADQGDSIQRFRREILHSRKVSHPNVSRIFESGRHVVEPTVPGGSSSEILFFTMELLEGETLRERIKRLGKMSTQQALPFVAQMASGLATAHAAGVVHRDFKSSNVFLVSATAGERAVVTDFGLARGDVEEASIASLTGTGDTLGTLAYMAPEQFGRSKGATSPVDIYALGVVMYEMVTGQVPFPDMFKKLTEKAPSPRSLTPDLDPKWESAILRCLERNPEDRFASAEDVIHALGGKPVTVGRKTERRMIVGAGIGVVLALVGGYYIAKSSSPLPNTEGAPSASPSVEPPKTVAIRRSVAVLGFQPPVGETGTGWISTALMELISGTAASGGHLRVVPLLQVTRVKSDIGIAAVAAPGGEQLEKLRKALPADAIVSGAYSFIGEGAERVLRVEMRLESPPGGPAAETWTISGSERDMPDLAARGGEAVREKLGAPRLLPAQQKEIASLLPSAAARKPYAEALDRLGRGDTAGARPLLEKVVAAEAGHPGAQAALALAWSLQGYQVKAAAAIARALTSSGGLPSDRKVLLEARGQEIESNWKAAIASYESLRTAFPDDPEYLLSLVEAQMQGGKTKDALVTLSDFRKLPKSVSEDPRIDLVEARAYARLGEHQQVLTAAARAAQKGTTLSSPRLVANGKFLEAVALDGLGQQEKGRAAAEEARRLFETAGDRLGLARAMLRIGTDLLGRQADPKGALQVYETALGIFREFGERLNEIRVLKDMGAALNVQGKNTEAEKRYDEALAIAEQIGAKREEAAVLNNLGSLRLLNGDLKGAQERYQKALGRLTELGEKRGAAVALSNLGEVLFARGDLKRSRDSHEESLGINRQLGDASGAAYDKYRIAEVLVQNGDLQTAESRYQESIKEQTDEGAAAETRMRLAALLVDAGRPAEAEKEARSAEETLRVQGLADIALWAHLEIVNAERAQGKFKEAKADLEKILPMIEKSSDSRVKLAALLAQTRIAAATDARGAGPALSPSLGNARQSAAKSGRVIDEFEVRLAVAELERGAGQASAGASSRKVAADARARGLEGIARKAEALNR